MKRQNKIEARKEYHSIYQLFNNAEPGKERQKILDMFTEKFGAICGVCKSRELFCECREYQGSLRL